MASVSNSISSRTSVHVLTEPKIVKKEPIVINFDILEEKYGINPAEIGTAYYMRDSSLAPISAGNLLELSLDLEESRFEKSPPISFTFKEALQYVIYLIENPQRTNPIFVGWGKGNNLAHDLYLAITNIDTKRPDLIPEPPRFDPICCAKSTDNNLWMGAILTILWDQGQIQEYGKKGEYFWVTDLK